MFDMRQLRSLSRGNRAGADGDPALHVHVEAHLSLGAPFQYSPASHGSSQIPGG